MKAKDLQMLRVIDCVIKKGPCPIEGKNSISEYFNIHEDKDNKEPKGIAPVCLRTLQRYVKELTDNGILVKEKSLYSIADTYVNENAFENINLEGIIYTLLECGEIALSKQLQEYLEHSERDDTKKNIVDKYLRTVREPIKLLHDDGEMITKINKAIEKEQEITLEYKGKIHSVVPICFVVNKNASQTYLYGVKRKKMCSPFILENYK